LKVDPVVASFANPRFVYTQVLEKGQRANEVENS